MMIPRATAEGIRDGTIRQAFRRWDAPRVKVGGTQVTAVGVVRFESCDPVASLAELTEADARSAGVPDLATLRSRLAPGDRPRGPRGGKGGTTVYRVGLSWVGVDPRVELRTQVASGPELDELITAVQRLDQSRRTGPWTHRILTWIAENPGVLANELALELDRERLPMKADIRKLKALGLTISLPRGYQLSPRGRGYLAAVRVDPATGLSIRQS